MHSYPRLDDGWKKEARRHQATQVPSVANVDMGTFVSPGVLIVPHVVAKALFGTSLTMADGVLTATVSVTSAVGGTGELLPNLIWCCPLRHHLE
jgi:hypothetical protein